MMTDIPDKAVEAAMRAFADKVTTQDESWIEVIDDDGTSIVAPSGDYFALDLPMRAALAAALSHMGGEPVAWRWRWKGHSAWHYGAHSANLEPGDFQPLYLAPSASPDVAALIEAARAMSRKLATINGHSATQRVYTLAYLHGEPYDGPTYEAELLALDAALSRLSQPGGRDE